MSVRPPPDPATRRRAIWMLCLACLLWASSFPIVKALALVHERVDPSSDGVLRTMSAIWPRFFLGWLMLVPLAWHRRQLRPTRRELHQGIGLALFLAGGLGLQVDGLQYTEASTSAFLTQSYVVLLPLWVFGRARRWPTRRFALGTVLAVAGLAILAGLKWNDLRLGRGEAQTILATVFFTGQILWLERPAYHGNRAVPVSLAMFAATGMIFFLAALLWERSAVPVLAPWWSGSWVLLSLLLAALCTFGAFTLMNTWQRWVSSAEAGIIYTLEPVFAVMLALFLPGLFAMMAGIQYDNETLTWRLLGGGGLISLANLIIQTGPALPSAAAGEHRRG